VHRINYLEQGIKHEDRIKGLENQLAQRRWKLVIAMAIIRGWRGSASGCSNSNESANSWRAVGSNSKESAATARERLVATASGQQQ